MKKAEGKSLIDYTFHICITKYQEQKDQIKGMVERGFTTFGSRCIQPRTRARRSLTEGSVGTPGTIPLERDQWTSMSLSPERRPPTSAQ